MSCLQACSSETALICSIIFYVFECLVSNTQQAIWHLNQGLNLSKRLWSNTPGVENGFDGTKHQLRSVFSRLDIHASIFTLERAPVLDLVSPEQISGQAHVVSEHFANLSEAEEALLALQSWTSRHLLFYLDFKGLPQDQIPPRVLSKRLQLKYEFQRLEEAVAKLATGIHVRSFTPAQQQQLRLIEIQARIFYGVVLENLIPCTDSEASSRFDLAIDQIAKMLGQGGKDWDSGFNRDFTLSSNIIAMLYFICMKTQDRRVLERSLSLMQGHLALARDGLWDSRTAVAIVKAMQEETLQCDEPAMAVKLEDVGHGIVDAKGGLDGAFKMLQITANGC